MQLNLIYYYYRWSNLGEAPYVVTAKVGDELELPSGAIELNSERVEWNIDLAPSVLREKQHLAAIEEAEAHVTAQSRNLEEAKEALAMLCCLPAPGAEDEVS